MAEEIKQEELDREALIDKILELLKGLGVREAYKILEQAQDKAAKIAILV